MPGPIFVHTLSGEEISELEKFINEDINYRDISASRIKAIYCRIILLSNQRYTAAEIAKQLKTSDQTVRRIIQRYEENGVEGLRDHRTTKSGRSRSLPQEWQSTLAKTAAKLTYNKNGRPSRFATTSELTELLTKQTGIKASQKQVRYYLSNYSYYKISEYWLSLLRNLVNVALHKNPNDQDIYHYIGSYRQLETIRLIQDAITNPTHTTMLRASHSLGHQLAPQIYVSVILFQEYLTLLVEESTTLKPT